MFSGSAASGTMPCVLLRIISPNGSVVKAFFNEFVSVAAETAINLPNGQLKPLPARPLVGAAMQRSDQDFQ
ncbi:hypothetical protein NHH03_00970 [Stieleria sp. TO1_6]|uniref:hypothetical protein n=1 Tax=Stieleria tagensis TaxID=2956795 RepID=UPI00209BB5E1|nr:hypothetical protein [Stieleria tagensis]MCO8120288.1 hypothetical protein [Stieleria tagensis]